MTEHNEQLSEESKQSLRESEEECDKMYRSVYGKPMPKKEDYELTFKNFIKYLLTV